MGWKRVDCGSERSFIEQTIVFATKDAMKSTEFYFSSHINTNITHTNVI